MEGHAKRTWREFYSFWPKEGALANRWKQPYLMPCLTWSHETLLTSFTLRNNFVPRTHCFCWLDFLPFSILWKMLKIILLGIFDDLHETLYTQSRDQYLQFHLGKSFKSKKKRKKKQPLQANERSRGRQFLMKLGRMVEGHATKPWC